MQPEIFNFRGPISFCRSKTAIESVVSRPIAPTAAITADGAAAVTLTQLEEGLPDPRSFQDLDFNEETVMYDRKKKVELAKFWEERREVVEFEDIPKIVLDATTGQNAISQAKLFTEAINVTGIFLAKLDGTAKGGIVLAIRDGLGVPVKLVERSSVS